MEDLFKQGHDLADDREQAEAQDRRHDQENERHLPPMTNAMTNANTSISGSGSRCG